MPQRPLSRARAALVIASRDRSSHSRSRDGEPIGQRHLAGREPIGQLLIPIETTGVCCVKLAPSASCPEEPSLHETIDPTTGRAK
jgi:hypothetical protein